MNPFDDATAAKKTGKKRGSSASNAERHWRRGRHSKGRHSVTEIVSKAPYGPPPLSMDRAAQPVWPIDIPSEFDWCDMSSPFFNPFCPTPNPMFNILIKFMIPSAIRPVIDQIKGALLNGQEFVLKLAQCVVPPTSFIETSEYQTAFGSGESKPLTPPVTVLLKTLYEGMAHEMTAKLSVLLMDAISAPVIAHLNQGLSWSLKEPLNASISHALDHVLANSVTLSVGHAVPTILNRLLPEILHSTLTSSVTSTLTRSVTHALTPSLIYALQGHRIDANQLVLDADYFGAY